MPASPHPPQTHPLEGKTVAVLMTDGVEQVEYTEPRAFLESQGARVVLLAPGEPGDEVAAFRHLTPGEHFRIEADVRDASPEAFDALVLPGGVANPDRLRLSSESIGFIRDFAATQKPVAAICHGPWTLIDAGVASGKTLTSWPSLKNDLGNAGATWQDAPVVVDGKLVTSRNPDDIPAFNHALFDLLVEADASAAGATSVQPGLADPQANRAPNVSEAEHNVQDEPGSQMTG